MKSCHLQQCGWNYSEISQPERQISYDFSHMWNLRNKTDEQREKEERESKLGVARGRGGGA